MKLITERKNIEILPQQFYLYTFFALFFLLLARVISNVLVPLNDTTEARYGEIARKMLETGNWVTPQHDYGIPFWAKPPLSSWLSALSMKLFGVNEFAARLPSLLLSIGVLWLIWSVSKRRSGSIIAWLSVLILSGSIYFFLDAGAVMTDPSLLFCTTLSLVAFWNGMTYCDKIWSYLFFVGLGLGLLAKGPIALVLVGMVVFFWVLLRNDWSNLWLRLPWFTGALLTVLIALPWYLLAEYRTPGFLNYFIMGEHVHRFLTPGWTGDKYGMAHDEPWGTIWIYAIAGIFPWTIIGGAWLVKYWKKTPAFCLTQDGWMSFLLVFTLSPLAFFTFSSNIIYPYVFPSLPAYALLLAEFWMRTVRSAWQLILVIGASMSTGILFLIIACLFHWTPSLISKTHKPVIALWKKQNPEPGSDLIYWDYRVEFSAQFYSAGQVKFAYNKESLCRLLANQKDNYLVVDKRFIQDNYFLQFLATQWVTMKTLKINGVPFILARCAASSCYPAICQAETHHNEHNKIKMPII